MKINILYPFKKGPWGGANQFLKAIRSYLDTRDSYEHSGIRADIVLFNASPSSDLSLLVDELYELKKKKSDLLVFVRIDGPIYLIRDKDLAIDNVFYQLCHTMADGVIYQSNWSKEKNIEQGMMGNFYETVIYNAPNSKIFNTKSRSFLRDKKRIRLISTSWSNNMKKGFSTYQWLDENLDFSKYDMVFVGNSPLSFNNIKLMPPMSSEMLAEELMKSDIFITASQKDPCSNSLIEALHCGLPSIVLKDGGHPELLGQGGEVFTKAEEIPGLIKKVSENYSNYQSNIKIPSMELTGCLYFDFFKNVFLDKKSHTYTPKTISWSKYIKIKLMLKLWRNKQRFWGLLAKVCQK